MSSSSDHDDWSSQNPLDSRSSVALVRVSRSILDETNRLIEAVEDQLWEVQSFSAENPRPESPTILSGDSMMITTLRATQVDQVDNFCRTYHTLGRDILEVFDDPIDAVGELGDAHRVLMAKYIELAFEILALQDDLAEGEEDLDGEAPDLDAT